MNIYDVYYRAFKNYRKETIDNKECQRTRNDLANSNMDFDKLESTKYLCTIEEDWVKAIEDGLVYVEKAVHEERQFIRTVGEVVPVEKVKKISKQSVEHLAKHSEVITHIPANKNDPIIPDKLYMVEKLSDYAVYENRFLYMLLCYLNDFINYRLERIQKLRMTYIGEVAFNKEIETKFRNLTIETKIYEKRTDNPYPIPDKTSIDVINRIKDCQQIVLALLGSNLMVQVAKTPMVKPPITKTNVLKMNNNFKNALALYDYVATYKGDGYSFEEIKKDYAPYSKKIADEFADVMNLETFLSFKVGNDIEDTLEKEFLEEEKRRREIEAQKLVDQINKLKKKALESNNTMEQYMLLLEKRNKMLENDSKELLIARNEIVLLNKKIDELHIEIDTLNRKIEELQGVIEEKIKEINYLNQKYIEDMAALRKQHAEEIQALQEAHQNEIDALNAAHEANVVEINAQHEANVAEINAQHEATLNEIQEAHAREIENSQQEHQKLVDGLIAEYETKVTSLSDNVSTLTNELKETTTNYSGQVTSLNQSITSLNEEREVLIGKYGHKLKDTENMYKKMLSEQEADFTGKLNDLTALNETIKKENYAIKSEITSIQIASGRMSVSQEFTQRERFIELQSQYEAFKEFFDEQWKLTKKEIRKKLLGEVKLEKLKKKNGIKSDEKITPVISNEEVKENSNNEVESTTEPLQMETQAEVESDISLQEVDATNLKDEEENTISFEKVEENSQKVKSEEQSASLKLEHTNSNEDAKNTQGKNIASNKQKKGKKK